MIPEDRLRELLHEATNGSEVGAGPHGIFRRLRRRRRNRKLAGVAGAVVAMAVVVTALVSSEARPRHEVTSAPTRPATSGVKPSTQLVVLNASQADTIDAATGAIVRTLHLEPSLPEDPTGQVSIDPSGRTAYVSWGAGSCAPTFIYAVDLINGDTRQMGTGIYPAVSPDGSRLARVVVSRGAGPADVLGPNCATSTISVNHLRTGMTTTWQLPAGPSGVAPDVTSLRWSPDGKSLVIGDNQASGMAVLDTTRPAGHTNPTAVRVEGYFVDPTELPDGQLVAYGPTCMPLVGCLDEKYDIRTLDPTTGMVLKTLYVDPQNGAITSASGLLVDQSGTQVAMLISSPALPLNGLAIVREGALQLVERNVGSAAAWLPDA